MNTVFWLSLLSIGLLLLAVIPAVLGEKSLDKERKNLLQNGEITKAEVLGYVKDEYLWVRYRFRSIENNQTIECRKIIGNLETQFPIGFEVPVRYKRQHPQISVLEPYASTQIPTS